LRQTLGGQYVFNFTGADTEREGAEGSVRARMTVAADNRQARLGQTQFRTNHVHNSLLG
jgi:hypothetical protein